METINNSLPLTLIERLLTIAIVHAAETSFTWGLPNQLLVPYLHAFGPRSDFPAPSQAALMRCWWIDCDTAAVATDLDTLVFLGQMADRHPHRPLQFTEKAMTLASQAEALPVLYWWVIRFGFAGCKYDYRAVMRSAAAAGAPHVLEWWFQAGLQVDFADVMRSAAGAGHIPVLEWCVARCGTTRGLRLTSALEEASKRGQIHVLEWWLSTGMKLRTWPFLEGAVRNGHVAVLDWWKAVASQPNRVGLQGPLMCTDRHGLLGALATSLEGGHHELLTIYEDHALLPRPLPVERIVTWAMGSGNVRLADWLWARIVNDRPLPDKADKGSAGGTPGNKDRIASFLSIRSGCWEHAAKKGHVSLLDWWYNKCTANIGTSKDPSSPLFGEEEALALEKWISDICYSGQAQAFEWCLAKYNSLFPGRPFQSISDSTLSLWAWRAAMRRDNGRFLKAVVASSQWQQCIQRASTCTYQELLRGVAHELWVRGNVDVLEWWRSTQDQQIAQRERQLNRYIPRCTVAVLDWATQVGIPIVCNDESESQSVFDCTSSYGNVAVLEWCRSKGFPIACTAAAFRSYSCYKPFKVDVFAWWIEVAKSHPNRDVRRVLGQALAASPHVILFHRYLHFFGKDMF